MGTYEEQSKRGELHSALCDLVKEHDMHEVVWMLGQILEDRGERLTFAGSALDIDGEQLKRVVVVGGEYAELIEHETKEKS